MGYVAPEREFRGRPPPQSVGTLLILGPAPDTAGGECLMEQLGHRWRQCPKVSSLETEPVPWIRQTTLLPETEHKAGEHSEGSTTALLASAVVLWKQT